jgi:hypothetical protein
MHGFNTKRTTSTTPMAALFNSTWQIAQFFIHFVAVTVTADMAGRWRMVSTQYCSGQSP